MSKENSKVSRISILLSTFFMVSRYLTLFIVTVRGLFLASSLGPALFGVYSLVILLQQQLSLTALGMREAVTISLSGQDLNDSNYTETISSSIGFTIFVGFLLFLISIPSYIFRDSIAAYHPALSYLWLAFTISGVAVSNEVLTNIARLNGFIKLIALVELSFALSTFAIALMVIFLGYSITSLFIGILCTSLIVFGVLFSTIFRNKKILIKKHILKSLLLLGLPLMMVNVLTVLTISFGLWIVGANESLHDAGQYAFAASLASVISYGINAYAWVYFAEIIGDFSKSSTSEFLSEKINEIRRFALLGLMVTSIFACFLYPYVIDPFFPKYTESSYIFFSLFLAQFFQILAFTENTLLMAKKEIQTVLKIVFSSFGVIVTLSSIFYLFLANYFTEIPNTFFISLIILTGNVVYFAGFLIYTRKYKIIRRFKRDLYLLLTTGIFALTFFMTNLHNYQTLFSLITLTLIVILFNKEILKIISSIKS